MELAGRDEILMLTAQERRDLALRANATGSVSTRRRQEYRRSLSFFGVTKRDPGNPDDSIFLIWAIPDSTGPS
jgi:hypothetical protein